MKEYSKSERLRSTKEFKRNEKYLEYVIDHVERETDHKFKQFLFLIDTLYIILEDKPESQRLSATTPMSEMRNHYEGVSESGSSPMMGSMYEYGQAQASIREELEAAAKRELVEDDIAAEVEAMSDEYSTETAAMTAKNKRDTESLFDSDLPW